MRLLYIDIDSLRPDYLSCYGYHRDTSPNIDAVARAGVRFDNCYITDAPCLPSRTAMWSGRSGFHTGVVGHGGPHHTPGEHPAYLARLRATGRAAHAEHLAAQHPDELAGASPSG